LAREVLAELSSSWSNIDEQNLDMGERNVKHLNLFLDGKFPKILGEYIVSAHITALVKPGGGIRLIVVENVWRSLVSKVSVAIIRHSLDGYLNDLHFDDGTIIGDTLVVRKTIELIIEDEPRCGLHLNVEKKAFWPKEDIISKLTGVFPPNVTQPFYVVKLLGGLASVDFNFSSTLVMKRVVKMIELIVTPRLRRKHEAFHLTLYFGGFGVYFAGIYAGKEVEKGDVVTLLKQIQKFYVAQDIGARVVLHIFSRISFIIARGVRT
nr:hypothetical protein [Tanacetum cinerariifolium]